MNDSTSLSYVVVASVNLPILQNRLQRFKQISGRMMRCKFVFVDVPVKHEIQARLYNKANVIILKKSVLYFNDFESSHRAI